MHRNFALVLEQQIHLSPGLNVITGESGSGKSVLIAALGQALGAPADDDFIRPPSQTAIAQAVFCLSAAGIVSSFWKSLLNIPLYDDAQYAGQLGDLCMLVNIQSFPGSHMHPGARTADR